MIEPRRYMCFAVGVSDRTWLRRISKEHHVSMSEWIRQRIAEARAAEAAAPKPEPADPADEEERAAA
jgi:hypothetical protein